MKALCQEAQTAKFLQGLLKPSALPRITWEENSEAFHSPEDGFWCRLRQIYDCVCNSRASEFHASRQKRQTKSSNYLQSENRNSRTQLQNNKWKFHKQYCKKNFFLNREAGPNTHKHSPQGLNAVKSISRTRWL